MIRGTSWTSPDDTYEKGRLSQYEDLGGDDEDLPAEVGSGLPGEQPAESAALT